MVSDVAMNSRFETKKSRGQRVKALMDKRKIRAKVTKSSKHASSQEEEDVVAMNMNIIVSEMQPSSQIINKEDIHDLKTRASLAEETEVTEVTDDTSKLDGEDLTLDLTVRTNRHLPEGNLTVAVNNDDAANEEEEEETVFSDVWNALENQEEGSSSASSSNKEEQETAFIVDEVPMEYSNTFDENTQITHEFSKTFDINDNGFSPDNNGGDHHCSPPTLLQDTEYSYFNGQNTLGTRTFEDEKTLGTRTFEDENTLGTRTFEEDDHTLQTRTFEELDEQSTCQEPPVSPTSLLVESFQSLFQCNGSGSRSPDDKPFDQKAQQAACAVKSVYSEGAEAVKEIIGEIKEDWRSFSKRKMTDMLSKMSEKSYHPKAEKSDKKKHARQAKV